MEIRHKVLVVEDDLMLASILVRHLTKAGMDVVLATTGATAFESVKKEAPECVVLDIFLPGKNGLDVLQEIREDAKTKNLKVVVVSNTDQKQHRDRAAELGADFILKAAVTPQEIADHITHMLE
jgi:DNA-binding response OmpR family regulator